jgi:hypothetical protein
VYELTFDFGDLSYGRWFYYESFGTKHATNKTERPSNTWVVYVKEDGTTEETKLLLTREQLLSWLQDCDEQEAMPRQGSGRRPNKVQRLLTWRDRQKKQARQVSPEEMYERLRGRR